MNNIYHRLLLLIAGATQKELASQIRYLKDESRGRMLLTYRTWIRVVGKEQVRAACPEETGYIINGCPDDFSAFVLRDDFLNVIFAKSREQLCSSET